jgi:hypothetical protein
MFHSVYHILSKFLSAGTHQQLTVIMKNFFFCKIPYENYLNATLSARKFYLFLASIVLFFALIRLQVLQYHPYNGRHGRKLIILLSQRTT